jgi:hypothetical protein
MTIPTTMQPSTHQVRFFSKEPIFSFVIASLSLVETLIFVYISSSLLNIELYRINFDAFMTLTLANLSTDS